jgi:RND family efflux transporter MFP subunit
MEAEPRGTAPLSANLVETSRGALPVPVKPTALRRRRGLGRRISAVAAILTALAAAFGVGRAAFWGAPTVTVTHPTRGPAIEAVYATGVIEAIDYARFGAMIAGRVTDVLVDEGYQVRKGDVLARMDERQPLARLDDARARLRMAEADIVRAHVLTNRGVLAAQALDRAEQERDQAAAAVDLYARQLEDYTIAAPLDGIVMKRNVEPGETVAANTVLFEVDSTARKRIAADVDERDIAGVRMGAPIAAHADGFPDQVFEARITNIRRQGDSSSRTFRVEADLPADTRLMIGMTVDVDIVTAERDNALLVPASAVGHGPSTGGRPGAPFVVVVDHGRARRVDVETGAVGPAKTEIRAGLVEADAVVRENPDRLRDGENLRIAP